MSRVYKTVSILGLFYYFLICVAWANETKLEFMISEKPVKSLTLQELKAKLKIYKITFRDPHYSKTKQYAAFMIQDVLRMAYGEEWEKDLYTDAIFNALDGYKAVAKLSKLKEKGGYLAFFDLDVGGWEPAGRTKANPGPFYLVWTEKQQTPAYEYPWPWQLASINLLRFEEQYPAVYPHKISKDSTIFRGFQIYKGRCFRCHSINQQGGKIGPDLNAPKSIATYRSQDMIKEFIKHPSKYRYTKMPDHLDLSEQDLNALLDYFWYKSKSK